MLKIISHLQMYFQTGKSPSLICDSQTTKYPEHCKGYQIITGILLLAD